MAQNVNPTFVKTPNNGLAQISTGSGSATVTVYTGGVSGTKVVSITATSCCTSAFDVQWGITNGGTFYPIGDKSVPASAGSTNSVPAVNLLDPSSAGTQGLPIDSDGNPFIFLKSTADTLTAKAPGGPVPASTAITLTVMSGDF